MFTNVDFNDIVVKKSCRYILKFRLFMYFFYQMYNLWHWFVIACIVYRKREKQSVSAYVCVCVCVCVCVGCVYMRVRVQHAFTR
jgi:hypothetical protein